MARSVPEPYAEAVRSAVLVKLREAVAAALVVDERAAEGTNRAFAFVPSWADWADVPAKNRVYVTWVVPSEAVPLRVEDLWNHFSRFGSLAFCNPRPLSSLSGAGYAFLGFANPGGVRVPQWAFVALAPGLHAQLGAAKGCLLYTSPSPRDRSLSRMPSSA